MRYRRIEYRYATVLASEQPGPIGGPWHGDRRDIRLAQTSWRPSADVFETADCIVVTVELAGVDPDDLDVVIFDDALVVEGQRHLPPDDPNGRFHGAEIRQGRFRLDVALPTAIDAERTSAESRRGLLEIRLPRPRARPAAPADAGMPGTRTGSTGGNDHGR
jgi:HSP20 family protein